MKSTKKIEVYFVDNDLLFLREINEKFSIERPYRLHTKVSVTEFLSELQDKTENNFIMVVINDMIISHGLNTKSVVEILPMIKGIDKEISVIVLTDNANRELKLTSSDLRPDAYIKKDNSMYFKLPPTINKIVCNYELKKSKRKLQIVIVIAIAIIAITIVYFATASIIG
ncbi:MAG: hypothetical protein J6T48_01335 [Bacteroidales bacterium]|nr:hypothetical protein [Bacteroidales bacterium]